jgi:hypothetical protein
MTWLTSSNIQKRKKNIGTRHDLNGAIDESGIFDIVLRLDNTLTETDKIYNIPRPIYENIDETIKNLHITNNSIKDFIEYKEEGIPIFGSFGFGFKRKNFSGLVRYINDNYDYAIIKLVIPVSFYQGLEEHVINDCIRANIKPNVRLMITHEFFENAELLKFLNSNTLNIFLYDNTNGAGVSSVIDYALSVDTPFAIIESTWFRHIYTEDLSVTKRHISFFIEHGKEIIKKYKQEHSNKNLQDKMKNVICK